MVRRLIIAVAALVLVACSNCDNKCTEGITFNVAEIAGALANGGKVPLHVCFDGDCKDVTITRDNSAGSVFLPFKGVGKDVDHDITVTGTASLKGEYKGKLQAFVQKPGGSCAVCGLATVKIGVDGTITPGSVPTPATATTVGVVAPPATTAAP
jgi:hypothetical protein